jgi:hypothetical protein
MQTDLENIQNDDVVLFGAGEWGRKILEFWRPQKVHYVIDNHKKDFEYNGNHIPVLSLAEYLKLNRNDKIIVASRLYHREIYNQLLENGVNPETIINVGG